MFLEWLFSRMCLIYFKVFCRLELSGEENIPLKGEKYVLIANHQSFLDVPLLIAIFRKQNFLFPVDTYIAKLPIMRWIGVLLKGKIFEMDPTNPMAIRNLIRKSWDEPEKNIVIFPEGRITVTGALMKVYSGAGMLADKTDAKILPVRIDGLEFSKLSRLGFLKLPRRWFPKVRLTILPLAEIKASPELVGRKRRLEVTEQVANIMAEKMFQTANTHKTLYQALLEQAKNYGWKRSILQDSTRQTMTYRKLVMASHILGKKIADQTPKGGYVGVMLPNSLALAATFWGLQRFGRVPAMLNFTSGVGNIKSALKAAQVKKVYTARKFVEMAKLQALVEALEDVVEVIYLEDVKAQVGLMDKLGGLVAARQTYKAPAQPNDPAVVLFTSGSEGAPKGVVLSHKNILSNIAQMSCRSDFNPSDRLLSAMPLFHSFGLVGGLILPLLKGVHTFLYPTPLHFRMIPELVYDYRATIMFGTDTFLRRYAMFAHSYDFTTLRFVFAGAEKLRAETQALWAEKYGVRVLEGYGATETSPGISTNTLIDSKKGTVGKILPGMDYNVHPVKGVASNSGRLHVAGPNVMLGYLKADAPGQIQPPETDEEGLGWYNTGDIVTLDDEGYIQVVGRVKRFAKVAGEMIPLGTIEEALSEYIPYAHHGIIAVEDSLKGEKLILFTTHQTLERKDVKAILQEKGLPDLYLPREIRPVDTIPLLGTGKVDYPKLMDAFNRKK